MTSATDSSTESSIDDSNPNLSGEPRRKTNQEDNRPRLNKGNGICGADSPKRKMRKRNRPKKSIPSRVSFGDVTVRIYCRSIGDWWDVQHGLSLGWEYEEMPAVPLPECDGSERSKSKLKKAVSKAKAKMNGWRLVNRNRRQSTGLIRADSVVDFEQKTDKARIRTKSREKRKGRAEKPSRKLSYEDCKPTSKCREELLKNFGFSSKELDESETERKLLRVEYSHWTGSNQNRPSTLFVERCLADIKDSTTPDRY